MRKSVTALAATPFLVFALASCSSGTSTPTNTTPETPTASMTASANAAKVEEYCAKVDATLAEAKKWTDEAKAAGDSTSTMTTAQAAKIKEKTTELTAQAQDLAAAVLAEPELTAKVTECSENLQDAPLGG